MPPLVRFIIRHGLIGFVIGAIFTAIILLLDIGSIRSLTAESADGLGVRLLLAFFICSTTSSIQIAIAVMSPPSRRIDPTAPPDAQDDEPAD